MKPAFVKKNTKGGAAGLSWEAGEVKVLHPTLAEQLVVLSPEDYEIVQAAEPTPEAPAHNAPSITIPSASSDGTGIGFQHPHSTVVEVPIKGSAEENEATAQSLSNVTKRPYKKSNKATETRSAE